MLYTGIFAFLVRTYYLKLYYLPFEIGFVHSHLICCHHLLFNAISLSYQAVFDSRLEVIHDASHMVMMEASSQVNSLIHSFLLQPSRMTQRSQDIADDGKANANNGSVDDFRSPSRSRSRTSLRSARTPRPRPQRLPSKSAMM